MDPYEMLDESAHEGSFDTIVLPEDKLHVIIKLIETQLRTKYQVLNLPHIKWLQNKQLDLNTIHIPMSTYVRNRFSLDERLTTSAPITELFKEVHSKFPRRLFVEGHSGYGKTTLALKIAYDWAKRQEYLSNFRAVFLISLRNVNCDLERVVTKECELEGFSNDDVWQTISYFQEDILLILDGLEEMNSASRRDLMHLLKRERFPHLCVLVTCTPGMFQVELDPASPTAAKAKRFTSIRTETGEKHPFWVKRIELLGVQKDHRLDFLRRYFGSNCDAIHDFLTQRLPMDTDYLCESPLFLLLLAELVVKEELEQVYTKTDLFKAAINYVTRRTFFTDKMLAGNETMDVFSLPGQNVFFRFGQLALESLKKGVNVFSEVDIFNRCGNDQKLLDAGFLFKNPNYPTHFHIDHYQVLHKSFLEFFASYYLANMDSVSASADHNLDTEIVSLMERGYDRDKECLLLTFLGNFLKTRAHLLFKSLSKWGAWYRADRTPLSNVLAELTITDEVVRSLSPLVPPKWEIDTWNFNPNFFNSESHCSLLRYGTMQKLIQILEWNPSYHCKIPEILHVDRLELRIADSFSVVKFLKTKITCTNFMCHFVRFEDSQWEQVLELFECIQSHKITLGVWALNNANVMVRIHKELTEGRWKNLQLHRLGLYGLNPHKDRRILFLAEDLISKNKIKEGVWIEIWKDSNVWNSFCGLFNARIRNEDAKSFFATASSSCLQEMIFISLSSQNMVMDMDQFFNVGKRPWKYIYTDGLIQFKLEKIKNQTTLPIKEIKLSWWKETNLNQALDILSLCHNVERIACRNELVRDLVEVVSSSWPGFSTTKELNIKFIKETVHLEQLDCLMSFKNLQKLTLDFGSLGSTPLPASVAATLIVIMPSLPLKMMEILRVTDVNIPFVERILGGMLYSDQKKEALHMWEKYNPLQFRGSSVEEMPWKNPQTGRLEVDAMKLGFHSEITATELKYCLSFILQLLANKQVKKFSLVDVNNDLEDDIFAQVFVHRECFRILREIEGLDITDTLRTHRKLNYLGLIRDRITLTYEEK